MIYSRSYRDQVAAEIAHYLNISTDYVSITAIQATSIECVVYRMCSLYVSVTTIQATNLASLPPPPTHGPPPPYTHTAAPTPFSLCLCVENTCLYV